MMYLANRFEFNCEQRYWLAFLYGATYCVPTAWFIFNEFPDFDLVDPDRLQRFWGSNRYRLAFQSDRRWVRSRNQFCDQVASYRKMTGSSQEGLFERFLISSDKRVNYNSAYKHMLNLYQFGRYSMFLYLEAVVVLTGLNIEPPDIDIRNAESSRNGLCFALGYDNLLTGEDYGRKNLSRDEIGFLNVQFDALSNCLAEADGGLSTVWNIETTLCAYKKVHRGTRYLGYYVDRQHDEIRHAEKEIPEGIHWGVMWDFRSGHYESKWLRERRNPGSAAPEYEDTHDKRHWYRRPAGYW